MARVPDSQLAESFRKAGISKEALHSALGKMCPQCLKAYDSKTTRKMRQEWSPANPTRFCCYFVSEMVYHYLAPQGSKAMALRVPGDDTLHRFVIWPDRSVVDLTCDQFGESFSEVIDYRMASARGFLQTGGKGPSRRARELAHLLGLGARGS